MRAKDGEIKVRCFVVEDVVVVEVEKDTLRVCYDFSGKDRPTEFKTAEGTQHFLVTYERKQP